MQGTQFGRRREAARVVLLAGALCLLASAVTSLAPAAAHASSGTLSMSPESTSLAVGDSTAVTFDLSGAVNVHEVDVYVLYNPNIVQVVDADSGTPGTQILPGPFPGNGGAVTANSAAGGSIQYQFALPPSVTASGSGTIATARFLAIANGDPGLSWGTVQLIDGNFTASTPSTSTTSFAVGGVSATATGGPAATDTPFATETPFATDTPAATTTALPTTTPVGTPTKTPSSPTAATTGTRTPTVTGTPPSTVTPRATASPRITVLQNSNQPTQTIDQKLGVDATSTDPKSTLPNAGNGASSTQWWRWTFFGAALMLGIAGWFFTFALHHADRDVVLLDRHDRRRRRP